MKDLPCLTDRKATNNEEYGTTLILSVDDEPVNHMVIEECISSTGYKVSCWRPFCREVLYTYSEPVHVTGPAARQPGLQF